ncbi:MAG TPA: DNA topoisomerase IB [Coriobacteriia bacterium]|nr:DNA topoisomerase IB [Coriobacteriia bacterium]
MVVDLGPSCEFAPPPAEDSVKAADAIGLTFSSDCQPGIRRKSEGAGFAYYRDDGKTLSAEELVRVSALRIPPAWTRVWICADALGHLQATGYDIRGRKQYRYHGLWHEVRGAAKFDRMVDFGTALPAIRRRVDRDLRRGTLDRRRVLALVVTLMDRTFARVGNAEYLRTNESFGLTTLKDEHAEVRGTRIRLRFRGKAGKEFDLELDDRRLARALQRTRDLPGEELFQYLDTEAHPRIVSSTDVNDYLREAAGTPTTSKDFRTWGGSLTAACALLNTARRGDDPQDKHVTAAIRLAADTLGNTPAVCKRSYVHPGLIELYRSGRFVEEWERAQRAAESRADSAALRWMSEDERAFLGVLKRLRESAEGESSDGYGLRGRD